MTTRRNFLKLAIAAPVAGVMAKLGVLSLEVKSKAAAITSRVNGFYTGLYVVVSDGTGRGQARQIISYDGATKTAMLGAPWDVAPDSTSLFVLAPRQLGQAPADMKFDA